MIKIDGYYSREDGDPKLILSIDAYTYEDVWHQRYMFDKARWGSLMMESLRVQNLNRHKYFRIALNILNYRINIDFKYKHVGNVYYGRVMLDEPKSFRKKKQENV